MSASEQKKQKDFFMAQMIGHQTATTLTSMEEFEEFIHEQKWPKTKPKRAFNEHLQKILDSCLEKEIKEVEENDLIGTTLRHFFNYKYYDNSLQYQNLGGLFYAITDTGYTLEEVSNKTLLDIVKELLDR